MDLPLWFVARTPGLEPEAGLPRRSRPNPSSVWPAGRSREAMAQATDPGSARTRGPADTLRLTASVAILALALLGVLVIFDVIPREELSSYSVKVVLTAAIVAVATVALGVVGRLGRRP